MPIQFQCQKCLQWLEVDEPHAGGKAICPFCQAVNDVPKQSTEPDKGHTVASASPEGPTEQTQKSPYTGVPTEHTRPTAPDVPVSKPLEEQERTHETPRREYEEGWFDAARSGLPRAPGSPWLGKTGLILTLSAWAMLLALNVLTFLFVPTDLFKQLQTPSGPQILLEHPWLIAMVLASLLAFLANIVGFGMSLAAFFGPRSDGKAYALAGMIAGGMLLLLGCAGMLMGSGMGG